MLNLGELPWYLLTLRLAYDWLLRRHKSQAVDVSQPASCNAWLGPKAPCLVGHHVHLMVPTHLARGAPHVAVLLLLGQPCSLTACCTHVWSAVMLDTQLLSDFVPNPKIVMNVAYRHWLRETAASRESLACWHMVKNWLWSTCSLLAVVRWHTYCFFFPFIQLHRSACDLSNTCHALLHSKPVAIKSRAWLSRVVCRCQLQAHTMYSRATLLLKQKSCLQCDYLSMGRGYDAIPDNKCLLW